MFTFLAIAIVIVTIVIVMIMAQMNGANDNQRYTNDAVGIYSGQGDNDDYGNEYYS